MSNIKRCIAIYTEGETDEEFYNKILDNLRDKIPNKRFNVEAIEKTCIRGIGNFSKKLLNKFKENVCLKYNNYEKIVILCYDLDVFFCSANPPVNREKLHNDLLAAGATKVIHIKANKSIEDVLLYDFEGIKKFLKLTKVTENDLPNNSGFIKIQFLFKKANRIYFKGYKIDKLINFLDLDKICNKFCNELKFLCNEIGVVCNK